MTIRVRFRREAEADVLDALAWYRERGLELGEEFLRALLSRFPYGVFYVREGDTITVLACFHAKRNPTTWEERAKG